jgi:hypothetical protein
LLVGPTPEGKGEPSPVGFMEGGGDNVRRYPIVPGDGLVGTTPEASVREPWTARWDSWKAVGTTT